MIITRTPFRISFLGGGTDYPAWYAENGGAVLSTSINRYCYLTVRNLPPFFEYRHRIVWSRIELVKTIEEIQHPVIRALLPLMDLPQGLEIHHDSDLPARTGLGSSSAFTVGLINALSALTQTFLTPRQLARSAIHIEQKVLREPVGIQDQISTAYGGFNHVSIDRGGQFRVVPMDLEPDRQRAFESHMLLFFTGISRFSAEAASDTIASMPKMSANLRRMQEMVDEGVEILTTNAAIADFGRLLDESWRRKRELSARISTSAIDDAYEAALAAGALGGKLLGAGGGGFLLFFAPPERHAAIVAALKGLLPVPFRFESSGSQIIINEEMNRATGALNDLE